MWLARSKRTLAVLAFAVLLLASQPSPVANSEIYTEKPLLVETWAMKVRGGAIIEALWSPSTGLLAVASNMVRGGEVEGELHVFDRRFSSIAYLSGLGGKVLDAAWSPSESGLAVVVESGGSTRLLLAGLDGSLDDLGYNGATAVAWSPMGLAVAVGGHVIVDGWEEPVALGFEARSLSWAGEYLLAYGPRGAALLRDGEVVLWVAAGDGLVAAATAAASGLLAVGFKDPVVQGAMSVLVVKSVGGGEWRLEETIYSFDFSPDGSLLVIDTLRNLRVYSVGGWELVWSHEWSGVRMPSSLAWSPDGTVIAYGEADEIILFSAEGEVIHKARVFTGAVGELAWSPSDSRLMAINETRSEVKVLQGPEGLGEIVVDGVVETLIIEFKDELKGRLQAYAPGVKGSFKVYATPGPYTVRAWMTVLPPSVDVAIIGDASELLREATLQEWSVEVEPGSEVRLEYDWARAVEKALAALDEEFAALYIDAPPGTEVAVEPGIHRFTLENGELEVYLEPGREYRILLALPGGETKAVTLAPEPGREYTINLAGTPAETQTGTTGATSTENTQTETITAETTRATTAAQEAATEASDSKSVEEGSRGPDATLILAGIGVAAILAAALLVLGRRGS